MLWCLHIGGCAPVELKMKSVDKLTYSEIYFSHDLEYLGFSFCCKCIKYVYTTNSTSYSSYVSNVCAENNLT